MLSPRPMATVHELPPPSRPSIIARLADGYANLMSRLGTGYDRNSAAAYFAAIMSQQQIEAAYRSSWLTRKVHDLVPFEMTRAGRDWQADQAQIEKLEARETELRVWQKLCVALTTARLHGGSALILGVTGAGSPEQPLDPARVPANGLRYIFVASRFHLHAPFGFEENPESDFFGAPSMWEMRSVKGNRVNIHPSRVITFHGSPLPPAAISISQLDQFWGDPLLISIKSAIDNAETVQAAISSLLHEMKQDVIYIPGLTEQIATVGAEERLGARIEAINTFKSMFNTLLLDRGDPEKENSGEEWETRQLSFTQHPELLDRFIGIVAGAADIPKTRLLGTSPGGLQSTGKGEQDDFNRMIAARQAFELAPPLARLDDILIPSVLGSRPPEVYSVFAPLEEADPKEAAEIEKLEAETVDLYTRSNHIPSEALAVAVVNRMTESGRWPGLDVTPADIAANEADKEAQAEAIRTAANENTVQNMEKRGTVTRDQAMVMLTDATPRSLYVSRKLLNAADVIRWAKAQGFTNTDPADELHVTLIYSRQAVDWIKAGGDDWNSDDNGNLLVKPGGPRLVEKLGDDGAVVLFFAAPRLSWRHEEIVRAGARFDYDEYQPHVTFAHEVPEGLDLRTVEPYRGPLRFGPEIFAEITEP